MLADGTKDLGSAGRDLAKRSSKEKVIVTTKGCTSRLEDIQIVDCQPVYANCIGFQTVKHYQKDQQCQDASQQQKAKQVLQCANADPTASQFQEKLKI